MLHVMCLAALLCGPRDWRVASGLTSAAIWTDAAYTRERRVSYELNPVARPFVHFPKPAYYAGTLGYCEAVNLAGYSLRRRGKRWWYVPQSIAIAGHSFGIVYSFSH